LGSNFESPYLTRRCAAGDVTFTTKCYIAFFALLVLLPGESVYETGLSSSSLIASLPPGFEDARLKVDITQGFL
jgi:hypothetical protein